MSGVPFKLVYVTPAIYSAGGVERVVTLKANYFAEVYGYDVTIIVTEGKGRSSFFPLSSRVQVINFELGFEELWNQPFWKKIVIYLFKQHKYRKTAARPEGPHGCFLSGFRFGEEKIILPHPPQSSHWR